jgi:hypothetical protein
MVLPGCALGAFVLATLPVSGQYLWLMRVVAVDLMGRTAHAVDFFAQIEGFFSALLHANILFVGLLPILAVALGVGGVVLFQHKVAAERHFLLAGGIFIGGGIVVLLQAVAASTYTDIEDPTVALRYLSPAYLVLPFAFYFTLYIFSLHTRAVVQYICGALGILFVAIGMYQMLAARSTLIDTRIAQAAAFEAAVDAEGDASHVVAIWASGNATARLIPAFHYWGNHNYAFNHFDEEVARAFPQTAFFQYRVAASILLPQILNPPGAGGGPLLQLFRRVKANTPPIYTRPSSILTAQELYSGKFPELFLFPERETSRGIFPQRESDFLALLKNSLGFSVELEHTTIAGEQWMLIKRSESS